MEYRPNEHTRKVGKRYMSWRILGGNTQKKKHYDNHDNLNGRDMASSSARLFTKEKQEILSRNTKSLTDYFLVSKEIRKHEKYKST